MVGRELAGNLRGGEQSCLVLDHDRFGSNTNIMSLSLHNKRHEREACGGVSHVS